MRATTNILKVLSVLDQQRQEQHYALQLSTSAKVNVGTVYAVLDRLEEAGLVRSALEDIDPVEAGRPQRRYYQISDQGETYLRREVQAMSTVLSGGRYV